MSNKKQGGRPPFSPKVLTNYRSLLVPEYTGPTPLSEDDMELYEVPITWEIPPPAVDHEYLPPTEIPAPYVEDFEQPFSFPIYDIETNPELEAAILDYSQYYLTRFQIRQRSWWLWHGLLPSSPTSIEPLPSAGTWLRLHDLHRG
ncbi:hypothetical protein RHGRI_000835 [Rhododendron griersonianum]|uniref:Uncharacterized protein n=2 Tax=Rhododendron griersonianum TaxID=479676 RepID=A0AAV6LI20_9ERIC|nr:hypothetical protein RHGRI_000835 [Rhododendron griersonianum]